MESLERTALAAFVLLTVAACGEEKTASEGTAARTETAEVPETVNSAGAPEDRALVPFETFTLSNGLKVIFHIDRSDPVVAVALTAHVGSAREKPGRTGFAHLFEHLLFLESENLGKGGLDKMSARIGGSGANGSTSHDRTNYFQTVPRDALEKMIWAEADKIGWFINTVTEPVLAKEKQVVKNEKRQGVDNVPYGHTSYVIDRNLYPEGHPYSWQVIGSLEDIQNATLEDVKEFYRRWYVPNNVTLTIAGDFDPRQARSWVEKYFGEIPRGPEVAPLEKRPAVLAEAKRFFHEDNFAVLPELTIAWPTVSRYAPDSYALNVLADLLSDGKTAPLNAALIDEKKLTAEVSMYGYNSELAGQMRLQVRAFAGKDLDEVKAAIDQALAAFEAEGIAPKDLKRVKTKQEVAFYGSIQTVLGKAFGLAQYDLFAGDPGFVEKDIENIRAVTAEDVMRVYRNYIKDKPFVMTSFVPRGAPELALEGSEPARIVEEKIVQGAEEEVDPHAQATYEHTPSRFDRSVEPPYGEPPVLPVLDIWEDEFDNGLRVYGLEDRELPLVRFELWLQGGHYLDRPEQAGRANLLAEILTKGTAGRTTAELEEALDLLGAAIEVEADQEYIVLSGQTLARNFEPVMNLLREMVLTPRWDREEFALARSRVLTAIRARRADPGALANDVFNLVTYGEDHILSHPLAGTETSVKALTLDDLKSFHRDNFSPGVATFHVAGAVSKDRVIDGLHALGTDWASREVTIPEHPEPDAPETSLVWFYDVPGAKQSVLIFGNPSLKRTDEDFYPAEVMNYILGGGGFASRLMQQVREGKGYTYGIRSDFSGSARHGMFEVTSAVRSNVTFEAADLVKRIMSDYGATFTDSDLAVTKSFLVKSKARAFESLGAKVGILTEISRYGFPYDYPLRETAIVKTMTRERIQELAAQLIDTGRMNYVVVGDASSQMDRLKGLGFGEPVRVNERLSALDK